MASYPGTIPPDLFPIALPDDDIYRKGNCQPIRALVGKWLICLEEEGTDMGAGASAVWRPGRDSVIERMEPRRETGN